jgi:hypothetical protein
MAKLTLAPDPNLTFEKIGPLLQQRLPQYSVTQINPMGQGRWVVADKESKVKGAGVAVVEKSDKTIVKVYGLVPSMGMRVLLMLGGFIPFIYVGLVTCKPVVENVVGALEAGPAAAAAPSP